MKRSLPLLAALLLAPLFALDQPTLDLALEPPALNTNPGPEYDAANRPGNMIIGLDRTPKGRLWAKLCRRYEWRRGLCL